jgi:hypothetical protein
MKTLEELGKRYGGPDCHTGTDKFSLHSYLETYTKYLAPYRDLPGYVMELGILGGHSLLMWEEYFTQAAVYGMDLCDQPVGGIGDLRPLIAEGTHNIFLGDASHSHLADELFPGIQFNVIIEDGGHNIEAQLAIYENFGKRLAPGGLYIIEDIWDIDASREQLQNIDPSREVEIIDLRHVKGRFDDLLVVIRA